VARFRIRPVGGGQPWLCRCLDERTHGPIVYHGLDPGKLFWHASPVCLVIWSVWLIWFVCLSG
jgi:hypothetical protein